MSEFSLGGSGDGSGMGKSLDEIIADRRLEQSQNLSGRGANNNSNNNKKNNSANNIKSKKNNDLANRSIAKNRAKRTAATNHRRGFSTEKKPTAMEIDQENYRQSRNTNASKRNQEQKLSNGRLPPNSSLRDKKKKKDNANANAPQKTPSKKQLNAAVQGMKTAGYCVPDGYTMTMQFIPIKAVATTGKGKGKGGQQQQQQNHGNNNKRGGGGGGGSRGGGRGGRK